MSRASSFFSMVDSKFAIAILIMIAMIFLVSFIVFFMILSIKKRSEAVKVKLPNLDSQGKVMKKDPEFKQEEKIVVELIDSEDDSIQEYNKNNDKSFYSALSMSTGSYIPKEDKEIEVEMPEVEEVDYEEIKRKKEVEMKEEQARRERENLLHLKELAKADIETSILDEGEKEDSSKERIMLSKASEEAEK